MPPKYAIFTTSKTAVPQPPSAHDNLIANGRQVQLRLPLMLCVVLFNNGVAAFSASMATLYMASSMKEKVLFNGDLANASAVFKAVAAAKVVDK